MNMKHTIRCPLCSDEKCVNNKATEGNDASVELIDSNDIIDLKADKNKNVLYAFLTILLMFVLLWPTSWALFQITKVWIVIPYLVTITFIYQGLWRLAHLFRDRYKRIEQELVDE